ncbi:hypothetical protein CC78DRAFT_163518 [Lojkania enalia]|uniref:Uncharacterized protein n=1 Tax=Lojkania enalia TaxID=147567 RepID=A0A9P4N4Q4_9PLEO|nr:hypothetical protein CC78DRAFT_163518 [Didymosphaeria enalia]
MEMLVIAYVPTAHDSEDMNGSQRSQMRSPFKQHNTSSSSLEGMERPVRSFKSFIRAVPPNPSPSSSKPLPPTPTKSTLSPPTAITPPASPRRMSSVASWKAPAEWYNDSVSGKDSLPVQPMPSNRTYSLLLPEPSPDPADNMMEVRLGQPTSTPPQQSRLLPIYERKNLELEPPRSPPKSALPLLPKSLGKSNAGDVPLQYLPGNTTPPVHSPSPVQKLAQIGSRADSPAGSAHSYTSHASTKEKAYASLGIGSPREQARPEQEYFQGSYSSGHDPEQYIQQNLRGRKLLAINRGHALSDDTWEDTEMDEKLRQLSFSQDYHALLANQYQEMRIKPAVLISGPPYESKAPEMSKEVHHLHDNNKLVPPPLMWTKSPNGTSRSAFRDDMSPPKSEESRKSNRITSWVPKRLSVAPQLGMPKEPRKESLPKKKPRSQLDSIKALGTKTVKKSQHDLRFSQFFPPSKSLRFRRRSVIETTSSKEGDPKGKQKEGSSPRNSFIQQNSKMLRVPGTGLAIIRTNPSPIPKSEPSSPTNRSAAPPRPSTSPHSGYIGSPEHQVSPVSGLSDLCSSHNSSQSASKPPRSTNKSRRSKESSSSMEPPQTSGFLPKSSETSILESTSKSISKWRRNSHGFWQPFHITSDLDHDSDDDDEQKAGLIDRAKEARRKHSEEMRKEKLKKSIRVLGPTDPSVAASYVQQETYGEDNKRLPGFMVSGPI